MSGRYALPRVPYRYGSTRTWEQVRKLKARIYVVKKALALRHQDLHFRDAGSAISQAAAISEDCRLTKCLERQDLRLKANGSKDRQGEIQKALHDSERHSSVPHEKA